jgi:hypothetical protein
MDLHLADKTALITGSTAGIGLEIARKLADEGAKVIVTGRNQAKLDQAVETIRASDGANVRGILADASTAEGAAALLNAAPRLDILVNNLGIYETKNFAEITDEDWPRISSGHAGAKLGPDHLHFQRVRSSHARSDDPLRHDQDGVARDFARSSRTDHGHECNGQFGAARADPL